MDLLSSTFSALPSMIAGQPSASTVGSALMSTPGTVGLSPSDVAGVSTGAPGSSSFFPVGQQDPSMFSIPNLVNPSSPVRQLLAPPSLPPVSMPSMTLSPAPQMDTTMPMLEAIVNASMQRGAQGLGGGNA